jgi:hypothetical protein
MSANPVLRRAIATGAAVSTGAVGLTGGLIALVATSGAPTTPASSVQPANSGVQQPVRDDGGTLRRGDDGGYDDGGGFVQAPPAQQLPVGGSNGS